MFYSPKLPRAQPEQHGARSPEHQLVNYKLKKIYCDRFYLDSSKTYMQLSLPEKDQIRQLVIILLLVISGQ